MFPGSSFHSMEYKYIDIITSRELVTVKIKNGIKEQTQTSDPIAIINTITSEINDAIDRYEVKSLDGLFTGWNHLESLGDFVKLNSDSILETNRMFCNCSNLDNTVFKWLGPLKNVKNAEWMFWNCSSLTSVPNKFQCPKLENGAQMFAQCVNLERIPDNFISKTLVSSVGMFQACSSLISIPNILDVPELVNSSFMFMSCRKLPLVPSRISAKSLKYAKCMFQGCYSITKVDSIMDMPCLTNCNYMFFKCTSLAYFSPQIRFPSLENAERMFSETAISAFDLSAFSELTLSLTGLFEGCKYLKEITCSNNSSITAASICKMCYGCVSLCNISGLACIIVSNLRSMCSVFSYCHDLADFTSISKWDVKNLQYTCSLFEHCHGMKELSFLSNWCPEKLKYCRNMFLSCRALSCTRGLTSWDFSNCISYENMFMDCLSLLFSNFHSLCWSYNVRCCYAGMLRGCMNFDLNETNLQALASIIDLGANIHGFLANCNDRISAFVAALHHCAFSSICTLDIQCLYRHKQPVQNICRCSSGCIGRSRSALESRVCDFPSKFYID